jgi:hypothetical protein
MARTRLGEPSHVPISAPFGGLHRWRGVRSECIRNRSLFSFTVAMRSRSGQRPGNSISACLKETASGAHRLVWIDRDEHAGRAAAGSSRASKMGPSSRAADWSLRCCNCSVPVASCTRDPKKSRLSLRYHVSGTFAHEVLNIRYAIGDFGFGKIAGPDGAS